MKDRIILTFLLVMLVGLPVALGQNISVGTVTQAELDKTQPPTAIAGTTQTTWQFMRDWNVTATWITMEAGVIVIKSALDPQTVLCIERQPQPTFTVSSTYLTPALMYPQEKPTLKLAVEAPKPAPIPARVCRTVEAWLEYRQ